MTQIKRQIEFSLVVFMLLIGCAFLLKMCYLSLALNTAFIILFLSIVYLYLRRRYQVNIPWLLLLFVFIAVEVDALGNFFRLYGQRFGPMQYDEFSHMTVQILVTPIIIWLLQGAFEKLGYRLPMLATSFLAATVMFSLASFYEIIELWDDLYFGGSRIWGRYDTAMDLQWDLCGITLGTMIANLVLGSHRLRRFRRFKSTSASE